MASLLSIAAAIAPNARPDCKTAFADPHDLMDQFGITTPRRLCHFIAQIMHETNGATTLSENLNYTTEAQLLKIFGAPHSAGITAAEAPGLIRNPAGLAERVYGVANPVLSKTLGNTQPGDGYLFRGRGLLQTTGRYNYTRVAQLTGLDCVADPDVILLAENLLIPALQYWKTADLNAAADADDIATVTKGINGGLNGLNDRRAWYAKAWAAANDDGPAPAAAAGSDLARYQAALNKAGATPTLTVDGKDGPRTRKAIQAFQAAHGLTADGQIGPKTKAALAPFL